MCGDEQKTKTPKSPIMINNKKFLEKNCEEIPSSESGKWWRLKNN